METRSRLVWAALAVSTLLASVATAGDIYVAKTGNDSWPGTIGQPKLTIKGGINAAVSGDTVHVRIGTYAESWIYIKGGVRVVSEDGLYAAKIYSGNSSAVRLEQNNAGIEGFEIYGNWNQGSAGDGLVRPLWSNNVWVKNCLIHDAPHDCDVVKIGASNVLIENCIIYNPAHRTDGVSYQENIDVYGTTVPDGVTIRGCWLYHTPERGGDYLLYAKGGSRNILWEKNIFGPAYSSPSGNASTSAGGPSPNVFPSCENFIARNNLFLECSGDGAFGLLGVRNCEFYNNVIWGYKGARAAIEFWTALPGGPANENFQFYNNIVMNQTRPVFSDRGYAPVVFGHDYNVYYQTGGGGSVNINAEANSLFVNPQLESPSSPVLGTDTWMSVVARFRLADGSPAVEEGTNLGALVATDIWGVARPYKAAYDIGPYEFVIPGDADQDGQVDIFDVIDTVVAFGVVQGDPDWNAGADYDHDGQITIFDVIDAVTNFGRSEL